MTQSIKDRLYVATFSGDAIKLIKDNKLNIEINDTCISENLDKEKLAATRSNIRNEILESGAEKVIFHAPFTEVHPAAIDHRIVDAARVRLEEAYALMKDVGAKRMVVHTGWVPFIYFPVWQVEKSVKFWKEFLADKPEDFYIYIENVLEDEPDMLKEIVKGVADERVKICLDTGHANAMKKSDDVYRWVEFLGNDIGHFHLHNNCEDDDNHLAFDEGSIDFDKLFDVIDKNCSDDVTFTIEAKDAGACIEWLKERGYI